MVGPRSVLRTPRHGRPRAAHLVLHGRHPGPAPRTPADVPQGAELDPRVAVQCGRYKEKVVRCTVAGCECTSSREFPVPEDEGTDVNIAVQMLADAYQHQAERMVLVSGDSDLVPPIRTIKQRFPKIRVTVYVPARDPRRGAATELRTAADEHETLPLGLLARAQFPVVVRTPNRSVVRPAAWTSKHGLEPIARPRPKRLLDAIPAFACRTPGDASHPTAADGRSRTEPRRQAPGTR